MLELLVTLAVAAVVTSLAVPSFRGLAERRAMDAAAQALRSDFVLARSEAIRRGHSVTICRSADGKACDGDPGSWHTGWIVFADHDGDGLVDAAVAATGSSTGTLADVVLRVQGQVAGIASIAATGGAGSTRSTITYNPGGLAPGVAGSFQVLVDTADTTRSRLMCLSMTGRLVLRAEGALAC